MTWVLLWIMIGSNGAIATGSAQFRSETACELAEVTLSRIHARATNKSGIKDHPTLESQCVKGSGDTL